MADDNDPWPPSGGQSELGSQKGENVADDNDVQAELARLRAENEALKARASTPLTFKVSAKGAVSVYGLGRFPVTLYKEQWERLLGMADDLRAFIAEHAAELKTLDRG